ncbi:MAG: TetR/AcrR family transcriptional regulator [Candidatus Moduliflexus flocculans]|nr:TetR/AcrR family transcriptional regulator [Candidatus Moduliflexus flocculans]
MGIQERKNREKEERRALILSKAKELILEHGIDALSMQEIADGTELSKATLYLYFQSKEAILKEILAESAIGLRGVRGVPDLPESSGIEALRTLWASYLSLYGDSHEVFVLTGINNFLEPASCWTWAGPAPTWRPARVGMLAMIASRAGAGDRRRDPQDGPQAPEAGPDGHPDRHGHHRHRGPSAPPRPGFPHHPDRDAEHVFELLIRGLAADGTDRSLAGTARPGSRPAPEPRGSLETRERNHGMERFFRRPWSSSPPWGRSPSSSRPSLPRARLDNNDFRFVPRDDPERLAAVRIDEDFGSQMMILVGLETEARDGPGARLPGAAPVAMSQALEARPGGRLRSSP